MGIVERLIEAALRRRALVLVGVVTLVVLGVWSVLRIPIDAFPDVTNIQVEVVSTAPGLSPLEVERFVTYPIETAMRGLARLGQVRSVSKSALSVVTVVFEDGVDIYFARQIVLERLIEARDRVPEGVEIAMGPVSTAMGEIYQYTLDGEPGAVGAPADATEFLTELRTIQDWVLAPLLKAVPGVSEINSFGGYIRQYQVIVDPDRLLAYDLTLDEIGEALRRNNLNVGGNVLERDERQYLVRGIGLLQSVEDIGAVVLKARQGTPVLLRDVAAIRTGQAVRQGGAIKDGKGEVVGGVVMMLRGANGRDVVRAVERRVGEINASGVLPHGLRIEPFYKRSDIIDRAVHTVTEALLIGCGPRRLRPLSVPAQLPRRVHRPAGPAARDAVHVRHDAAGRPLGQPHVARRAGHLHRDDHRRDHHPGRERPAPALGTGRGGGQVPRPSSGRPRGPQAVDLRRAHHRPDLHPHHRPAGDRGQDVPAAGLHPRHRPAGLAAAFARRPSRPSATSS